VYVRKYLIFIRKTMVFRVAFGTPRRGGIDWAIRAVAAAGGID